MRGKIIVVGGQKGGPGKSTIAQNLAAYFLIVHSKDVLLIDADPQGTTADWIDERSQNSLLQKDIIGARASGNIDKTLMDMSTKYDFVVVDTGGVDSRELRSAIIVADLCIFPFRPKRRDIKTLPNVATIAEDANRINKSCKFFSVMTQCPNHSNQEYRIDATKNACTNAGLPALDAFTQVRNIYDDCDEGGSTVLEQSDQKAVAEIMAIGHEIVNRGELLSEKERVHVRSDREKQEAQYS